MEQTQMDKPAGTNARADLRDCRRILVVGCCGSGKSTMAAALGGLLALPVVHLDRLSWMDGWTTRPDADFDALLEKAVAESRWIIDGNYGRTLSVRIARCDGVIWLNYSRRTCMFSVIRRQLVWHGKTRPDMGENCPERVSFEFLKWVWQHYRIVYNRYTKLLPDLTADKTVVILRSRREGRRLLEELA